VAMIQPCRRSPGSQVPSPHGRRLYHAPARLRWPWNRKGNRHDGAASSVSRSGRKPCGLVEAPILARTHLFWRQGAVAGVLRHAGGGAPGACRCGETFRVAVEAGGSASVNIIGAIDDPNLLGGSIKDQASFAPWKTLLASVFGLPLDPDQLELYRQCTNRTAPPSAPFRSIFLCIGRRGGKSVCMALVAAYLATFRDWRPKLTAGEERLFC
jgi:hypothetical protein